MLVPGCLINSPSVTHSPHHHHHAHADVDDGMKRMERLAIFLEAHFGDSGVELHEAMPDGEDGQEEQSTSFVVRMGEAEAAINLENMVC
jgi:hypothetical protein